MRVLEVIHGYPPLYNAGSEIYTQMVARGLRTAGHHVAVFTREDDPFRESFAVRRAVDGKGGGIPIYLVNHPQSRDRFKHEELDRVFFHVLEEERPDVVHIGHLNHLSLGIPEVAKSFGCRVVLTLHDYWFACPRGQFLQMGPLPSGPWPSCEGQVDGRCAERCYSRYWPGTSEERQDMDYWTDWVHRRMEEVHHQLKFVDTVLAPSRYLRARVSQELGLPSERVRYEPYGLDRQRLTGRIRTQSQGLVFGFMGRVTPAKGIHQLLEAFGRTSGEARLRIWGILGEPERGPLLRLIEALPPDRARRIEWMGGYRNEDIVTHVLNHLDVLVVPSIWEENSPLVIHEAQQAGIPIITSSMGGMGELVRHGLNGWTYAHRDVRALTGRLQDAINNPERLLTLGRRGYLESQDGQVPSIEEHVSRLEAYFRGGAPTALPIGSSASQEVLP
ncbi:MAG: glycosyltransferase family 4 protein [Nitrososphaerota archaeon]|nr:glycosyltransferase family 4 protein [Nitrososphaerota archaeon]